MAQTVKNSGKEQYEVSARDVELLDELGRRYDKQVVRTSECGGHYPTEDDRRAIRANDLAEDLAERCLRMVVVQGREVEVPVEGQVLFELDDDEYSLLFEARRLVDVPEQRVS